MATSQRPKGVHCATRPCWDRSLTIRPQWGRTAYIAPLSMKLDASSIFRWLVQPFCWSRDLVFALPAVATMGVLYATRCYGLCWYKGFFILLQAAVSVGLATHEGWGGIYPTLVLLLCLPCWCLLASAASAASAVTDSCSRFHAPSHTMQS